MGFVKVRHADGREADVTAGEVAFYRSMGFDPAKGSAGGDGGDEAPAANDRPLPAANGTDQRLDLLIDEIRGLRADLAARGEPAWSEPIEGETVELREPGEPGAVGATAPATDAEPPNLRAMKRDELEAHARTVGVADPASYPTKDDLIEAIERAGA